MLNKKDGPTLLLRKRFKKSFFGEEGHGGIDALLWLVLEEHFLHPPDIDGFLYTLFLNISCKDICSIHIIDHLVGKLSSC